MWRLLANTRVYECTRSIICHRDTLKLNCDDFRNKLEQNLSQYFKNCEALNQLICNIIFNRFVNVIRAAIDAHQGGIKKICLIEKE